jgi:hypothetical protein
MKPEQVDFADVLLASLLDYERHMNVLIRSLEALVRYEAKLKGFDDAEVSAAISDITLLG